MSSSDIEEWLDKYGCNLQTYMSNVKVLSNKESSSDSIILFGKLEILEISEILKIPYNVVFKIMFVSNDIFNNSLLVEQQIYENVIDNLLNNYHTPHLTKFIGLVKQCDTIKFKSQLSPLERVNFDKAVSVLKSKDKSLNEINILITEKSEGTTLKDYFNKLQSDDLFKIIFQLLYTLRCFEKIGLSHNDLHSSNVFIDKLNKPIERIYYISDDKWVKFESYYDVKIYDFDRSSIYHPSINRNFTLDINPFYFKTNQNNKYESRNDLSSICSIFAKYEKNNDVLTYLKSITSPEFYQSLIKRPYAHLNAVMDENGSYKQGPKIMDNDIRSIAVCIDVLLQEPNFSKNIKVKNGPSKGRVYTLPPKIQETYWNPVSSFTHKNFNIPLRDSSDIYFTDGYFNKQFKYVNKAFDTSIYDNEFGKDTMKENCKLLFHEYLILKTVNEVMNVQIVIACYVLTIPFIYKLSSEDMGKFLQIIVNKKYESLIKIFVLIIDDVWNIFNNTLPIKVLKV